MEINNEKLGLLFGKKVPKGEQGGERGDHPVTFGKK